MKTTSELYMNNNPLPLYAAFTFIKNVVTHCPVWSSLKD